jgi:hypothetical protein
MFIFEFHCIATNIEDLHEAATSQIDNEDQHGTNRFGHESISG